MTNNLCFLRGNIATNNITLKETKTGKVFVSFNLAVKKSKNSEECYFFRINAFNRMAEILAKYYKKGDLIRLSGHLQVSNYEKEGVNIISTDIVCEEVEPISYKKATIEDIVEKPEEVTTYHQEKIDDIDEEGF